MSRKLFWQIVALIAIFFGLYLVILEVRDAQTRAMWDHDKANVNKATSANSPTKPMAILREEFKDDPAGLNQLTSIYHNQGVDIENAN